MTIQSHAKWHSDKMQIKHKATFQRLRRFEMSSFFFLPAAVKHIVDHIWIIYFRFESDFFFSTWRKRGIISRNSKEIGKCVIELRKQNRKYRRKSTLTTTILFAAALLIGVVSSRWEDSSDAHGSGQVSQADVDTTDQNLEVHFIDIGQGDCTLIMCGGHAMLIDAGDNDKGTAVQLYLKKRGIERLDYFVMTHPDADHIGGADVVLTKFDVDTVFMSYFEKDTKTYEDVVQALDYKNMTWQTPEPGDSYALGDAFCTIVAPNDLYEDANNASIALLLQYGETKFLFTGDCEEEAENDILENGMDIHADVYQAGHHGSRTASSQDFMDAVKPTYAVISCGEGNDYGHPHAEVLNRLRQMGIKVFRTDEQGSIVAVSDGKDISWNCAPSETWQTGE